MSTATAKKPRTRKASAEKSESAPEPRPEPAPILGVDLKGELLDIELSKIIDPQLPSDRLARDGDDERVRHLAKSMSEVGQLQPVMLERLVDGRFARVFGRRRVSAARILKWEKVRAVVVPPLPDDVRRTVVAVENVQRQDLTPAEETLAVSELLELQAIPAARQYGKPLCDLCGDQAGVSYVGFKNAGELLPDVLHKIIPNILKDPKVRAIACELVAAMLAKPATWVRDRMYLLRLPDKARKLVLEGKLPLAHAREISKLADEKRRAELADDYAAGGDCSISDTEPGKLEDLQEDVRRSVFALNVIIWNPAVPFANRPACVRCPHNSTSSPGLFEHGGQVSRDMVGGRGTYSTVDAEKASEAGVCTQPSCYQDKLRAARAAISATAKKIADRPKLKKGEPAPKPVSIPPYVDAKALDKKVRDRREMSRGSTSVGCGAPPKADPAKAARAAAMQEAQRKLAEAKRARFDASAKLVHEKVNKIPGASLLLSLLLNSKEFRAMRQTWNTAKCRKLVQQPRTAAALKAITKPTLNDFLKLDKSQEYQCLGYEDRETGMVEVLAKVLGVKLAPEPTLDQFLKEAKAAAVKPAAKAGAKDTDAAEEDDE